MVSRLKDLEFPFWHDGKRPGASRQQIAQLESDIGHELPGELRKALVLRDGGVSNYSAFQRGDYSVPLPAFFSIDELRQAEQMREEFGTPSGIMAIASGGHEWLGLDYRNGPPPKIVFQENEESEIETVAESFESLLDGLITE